MKRVAILALMWVSCGVSAHGPTPQKVVETVEINAPVDKVWAAVKHFDGIAQWNPALEKSGGDGTDKPGDKRTLTFKNAQALVEELDAYDEQAHEYNYRLAKDNVKALPSSSYSALLKLTPTGAGTKVEWKSRLYRGDTGNFPAEELTDEAAVKAMQGFFKTGLENLKKTLEAGR